MAAIINCRIYIVPPLNDSPRAEILKPLSVQPVVCIRFDNFFISFIPFPIGKIEVDYSKLVVLKKKDFELYNVKNV